MEYYEVEIVSNDSDPNAIYKFRTFDNAADFLYDDGYVEVEDYNGREVFEKVVGLVHCTAYINIMEFPVELDTENGIKNFGFED